jgi:hypothetical protein
MQCHSYRLLLGVAPIGVWIYTLALYQEIVFLGRVFVNFVQEIQAVSKKPHRVPATAVAEKKRSHLTMWLHGEIAPLGRPVPFGSDQRRRKRK